MQVRPRLSAEEYAIVQNYRNVGGDSRVLVIGDLHEPFTKRGYIEHCQEIQAKYNTNETVFIGDITDNHFSSFHMTDPDGHSAAEELKRAKDKIALWYECFPNATVTIGNHDRLPNRKAFAGGVSKMWIKSIGEVLETPNWDFVEQVIKDNVLYVHGENRQADMRAKNDQISVVQGHWHTKGYISYFVGMHHKIFAMQVGSGIDAKAYAMAYGKHFNKPHISCGVVLDNGKLPILEYMNL